eukprot:jgi/Undpi1/13652/HiC_scaffold_9.g03306.m1
MVLSALHGRRARPVHSDHLDASHQDVGPKGRDHREISRVALVVRNAGIGKVQACFFDRAQRESRISSGTTGNGLERCNADIHHPTVVPAMVAGVVEGECRQRLKNGIFCFGATCVFAHVGHTRIAGNSTKCQGATGGGSSDGGAAASGAAAAQAPAKKTKVKVKTKAEVAGSGGGGGRSTGGGGSGSGGGSCNGESGVGVSTRCLDAKADA